MKFAVGVVCCLLFLSACGGGTTNSADTSARSSATSSGEAAPTTTTPAPTTTAATPTTTAAAPTTTTAAPVTTAPQTNSPTTALGLERPDGPTEAKKAQCEDKGTYTYCTGEGMPVVVGAPDLYGQVIEYSPEMVCAGDLDIRICEEAMHALLLAISVWGNYGPVEYYITGIDEDAGQALVDFYCERRAERNGHRLSDCVQKQQEWGMGLENARFNNESHLESNSTGGAVVSSSETRQLNILQYTAGLPWGLDESYLGPKPTATGYGAQKTVFHEYFHGIQQSALTSPNGAARDSKAGPRWFREGTAEYMAQLETHRQRANGNLTLTEIGGQGDYDFHYWMRLYLQLSKQTFARCGGFLADSGWGDKCDDYFAAYGAGAWAFAYLTNRYGEDSLLEVLYPVIEEKGFEGAFLHTFEMTVEEFYVEFENFFALPETEQMAILPQ